jgi:hypothetical protein
MKITKYEIIGSTLVISLLLNVALLIVLFHEEPGFDVRIHEGGMANTYKRGWFKNEEHPLKVIDGEWHVQWQTGEWTRVEFDVGQ